MTRRTVYATALVVFLASECPSAVGCAVRLMMPSQLAPPPSPASSSRDGSAGTCPQYVVDRDNRPAIFARPARLLTRSLPPSQPSGVPIHYTYGLHSRCNSVTDECNYFPQQADCHGDERAFCTLWRSVGFLMSLAVVLEGMTLIAFVVMLAGGKQKRENGWRIVCALLCIVAVVQCLAMAFIAYLYNNDDRFFPGWKLDE